MASPTSRKVTRWNGGGRSSTDWDGTHPPGDVIFTWNTYNLGRALATTAGGMEHLMAERPRDILICSCDGTIPLDEGAVTRGCHRASTLVAHQLCRLELDQFRKAAASGQPLT